MLDVILIYRILYGKSIAKTHFSHSTSNRTDVWNFYCRLLVPRTSWFFQELVIPRTNPPLLSILKHIAQQIRVGLITGYITSKLTNILFLNIVRRVILWSYFAHIYYKHYLHQKFGGRRPLGGGTRPSFSVFSRKLLRRTTGPPQPSGVTCRTTHTFTWNHLAKKLFKLTVHFYWKQFW